MFLGGWRGKLKRNQSNFVIFSRADKIFKKGKGGWGGGGGRD